MRVSIAMATYNGAEYIGDQLKSILVQTRKPDELIVSDDISTDSTIEILNEFKNTAPFPVHIFKNEKQLGFAQNFNNALMNTTGDIVFLSDQDDYWFDNKIETIIGLFQHTKQSVILNDAVITDSKLNSTDFTQLGQIRSGKLSDSLYVLGCCAAIRKSFLKICLPIPEGYSSHDGWIVKLAEGLGEKYIFEKGLQYYRRHGKNETNYIVNKQTKLKPYHVYLDKIRKAHTKPDIDYKYKQKSQKQLDLQTDLMIERLEKISITNNSIDKNSVAMFKNHLMQLKDLKVRRDLIRKHSFPKRFLLSSKFWINGHYKNFRGMNSFLRDILFKNY